MTLPEINRHWIGIPALALAIAALGLIGSVAFNRATHSLSQIGTQEIKQAASAANTDLTDRWLSQLGRIPKNAFGSAQSQNSSANQPGAVSSEAKNWTEEEWRLASAAVAANRRGGKSALNPAASPNTVWQPPEEITSENGRRAK